MTIVLSVISSLSKDVELKNVILRQVQGYQRAGNQKQRVQLQEGELQKHLQKYLEKLNILQEEDLIL